MSSKNTVERLCLPTPAAEQDAATDSDSGAAELLLECAVCKDALEPDAFNKTQRARARRKTKARCRRCLADYDRARKYGMQPDQFVAMLNKQNRGCAICRDALLEDHRTHVDHCHESGAVRAILCIECNILLGKARDSPALCLRAAEYLLEHDPLKKTQAVRDVCRRVHDSVALD